jgi:hypothetical protein
MFRSSALVAVALIPPLGSAFFLFAQENPSPRREREDRAPVRYEAEDGVPKDNAGEKRRDYAVFEAALNDLTSARNPEHKHHIKRFGAGREIVLDDNTYNFDLLMDIGAVSRNIDQHDPRTIPVDIQEDFERRNDRRPRSLKDFKPASSKIIVRDLDGMFEKADSTFGALDAFSKHYPTAWGFVWAFRPGYSKDGNSALVVFEGGPNGIHGLTWVYVLTKKARRWDVAWRHCRLGE